jgi:hypothetical protein
MKSNGNKISIIFNTLAVIVLMAILNNKTNAQCVVTSATGYMVSLSVTPTQVAVSSKNCANGYNFNYELQYNISFSGSNIPSSLHVLQGNVVAAGFSKNFFDLPNGGTANSVGNSWNNKSNCNTITVASLNPTIEIMIQGPGIANQTISCPVIGLPVELMAFTATKIEEGIMLNWATASEKNNDYFTVERSSDATNWEVVEHIKGAGNSDQLIEYSYTDVQAANGVNYYRLKQTDFNGRSVYSTMLTVDYSSQTIETSIYPNPATGSTVTIRVATPSEEMIEVEIFNTLGQKLQNYTISTGNGLINHTINLPESGNMFLVNILQNNTVIGKHQLLVR